MKTFSIIIPMYNLKNYIVDTLRSIIKNGNQDQYELILVDDGSTDGTTAIAEAFLMEHTGCTYRILTKENSGVSDARNIGVLESKGKYLIFCDGDDWFEPDLLNNVSGAAVSDSDMIVWRYRILQGENETISQKECEEGIFSGVEMMHKHLLEGYRVRLGSFAVKKELLLKNDLQFTSGCNYAEDTEFILKCLFCSQTVHFLAPVLFCYRKRSGSLMYSYNINRFEAPRAILRVISYVQDRNGAGLDDITKEYLEHGLFILHCIFSFDACLMNRGKQESVFQIYQDYMKQYPDVEIYLKKILKKTQTIPVVISRKKYNLFRFSRKAYLMLYAIRI